MAFRKLTGRLEYWGSYVVFLTSNANTHHIPCAASIEGKTVRVRSGRIKQVTNGIQFYANDQPFYLGYGFLLEIHDGNGVVIWRNRAHR